MVAVADTGGGGGGGRASAPLPPHKHLDFVLLTLLAMDVQTLRKGYKAGVEVDLLQRQSIVAMNAVCVINTTFLPRSARK